MQRITAGFLASALCCLLLTSRPVQAQPPGAAWKPGDQVELKGSPYRGTVVAVDGDKVSVLVSVPSAEVVKPGTSTPSTGNPTTTTDPGTPAAPKSKYAGTWQASDRTLVVYDDTKFRILWSDGSRVHVDDGTYTFSPDNQTFQFRSKEDELWPWRLHRFADDELTISHTDVGTRVFTKVTANPGHPLVGTWLVDWTTDRGRSGTAQMYLYSEGMFLIYEDDAYNDSNDHSEYGTWTADLAAKTLAIRFHYNRSFWKVTGSLDQTDKDHFVWVFRNLGNEQYTYRCRRKAAP